MFEKYTPKTIRNAKVQGNSESLSVLGAAGARAKAEKKRKEKERIAEEHEVSNEAHTLSQAEHPPQHVVDEYERMRSANEDIIPPETYN